MNKTGLIAASFTPINSNDEVNPSILYDYAEYLAAQNIKGVFINGSTSDYTSLTFEERTTLMSAWAKIDLPEFEKMAHVGSNSIKEACQLAQISKDLGMDSISALGPYYFKPKTVDDLVDFCRKISGSASLPFYYYHIPQLTGLHFNMEEFIDKASKNIPDFQGIKFSVPDLVEYQKCIKLGADLLFGSDENLLPAMSVGAKGFVGSTYNHLPALYYGIIDSVYKGDMAKASELQLLSVRFIDILVKYGFHGAGKEVMRHIGLDFGPTRLPHSNLSNVQAEELLSEIEEAGISTYFRYA